MGRGLIQIKDKYFEWSTISDSPVSLSMSIKQLKSYIKSEYGNTGVKELPDRLKRCEDYGTSFVGDNLESLVFTNRAGIRESCISVEQIFDVYKNKKSYNNYFFKEEECLDT